MEYSLRCSCGNSLTVSEGAAGTDAKCKCGQVVPVPSFAELRTQAGLLTQLSVAPEAIRNMIASGSLPTKTDCGLCGIVTKDTADICVEWKVHTSASSATAFDAAASVFLGAQKYRVEIHRMNLRARLCPFCVADAARFQLVPALIGTTLGILIVVSAFWQPLTLLLLGVVPTCFIAGMRIAGRRRQRLLRSALLQEPIYKQVLEQEQFVEAKFQLIDGPKTAPAKWPADSI
jgi:hypothetical protein